MRPIYEYLPEIGPVGNAICCMTTLFFRAAAEPSHLTFNAPLYTVLLLLVALIVGSWSRYINHVLRRGTNDRE